MRDPNSPKKLVEGAGDFTKKDGTQSNGVPQTRANQTHSAFAWKQRTRRKETGKVYVVLVDDMEELDVDVLDITNPSKPKLVSETNLDQFAQPEATRPHGDSVFSHDMVVKHIGGRDVMLMSYWDGGYVTLDVSNPVAPKAISDTDFAAADPARPTVRADDHPRRGTVTRRSSRATTGSSSRRTRTSTPTGSRPRSKAARRPGGPSRPSRRPTPWPSTRTTRSPATRFLGLGCSRAPAAGARSRSPSAACATSRSSSTTPRPRATRA